MLVKAEQLLNAFIPILVTPLGMVTLVRELHWLKRKLLILVKLSGKSMLESIEQPENALPPIVVMPSGRVISTR